MGKGDILEAVGKLEAFARPPAGFRDLGKRLAAANAQEDRGSVFFIGSVIAQRVWKGLSAEIDQWTREHPDESKDPDLDKGLSRALLDLDHFIAALERVSVGPFVFDQRKEETMVATTRDRLLLTKVVVRALLERNWRKEVPKINIELSLTGLISEVVALRRRMDDLEAELKNARSDRRGHARILCIDRDCCSSPSATIIVHVPEDARLRFDGEPSASTGGTRTFESPPLRPGHTFYYTLEKITRRDGKDLVVSQRIPVRAFGITEVDFP
jgi:uncharacterized protein (TIGR03000 family)